MKTAALWISLLLLLLVILGALRTIFERKVLFLRKFGEETQKSYMVLAVAGALLLAWSANVLGRLQSFEIVGLIKAQLNDVQQKVDTLSEQMEKVFKLKKIEIFDSHNWAKVHRVNAAGQGIELEVTLERAPIPNSVQVYEGVLLMPEEKYKVEGRVVRFPANTDKPDIGLKIEYYPLQDADQGQQTPQ
jgi:hypothetical protein